MKNIIKMLSKITLPKESDFPKGTEFYIKDWDVPLSKQPDSNGQTVSYFNWYGGKPRPYPVDSLKIDNNWPADSFSQWLKLIEKSTQKALK
jgi:hypothetical protein